MLSLSVFEGNTRRIAELLDHEDFRTEERYVLAGNRLYTDFTDVFVIPGSDKFNFIFTNSFLNFFNKESGKKWL